MQRKSRSAIFALAVACLAFATVVRAAGLTGSSFWYQRGNENPLEIQSERIEGQSPSAGGYAFRVETAPGRFTVLEFAPPSGLPLRTGAYEQAQPQRVDETRPVLAFSGHLAEACPSSDGRFAISVLSAHSGDILAFTANFERYCNGNREFGEFRVDRGFSGAPPPGPDPMAFLDSSSLAPGIEVVSNETTVISSVVVPIAVTGASYSVNGGPFVTGAGVVSNRDRVRLKATAPPAADQMSQAIATIGGLQVPWHLSTYAGNTSFAYRSQPGESIGKGQTARLALPSARFLRPMLTNDTAMVSFRINGANRVVLSAPRGAVLAPGSYEDAKLTYSNPIDGAPGIGIGIGARECVGNMVGRFTVHEIAYEADRLGRLSADIEFRCFLDTAPLFAEIRFNSNHPTSIQPPQDCSLDSDGDGVGDCIEWEQGSDSYTRDNFVFTHAEVFARQQFRDFLAREGEPEGVAYWKGRMDGGMSRAAVIEQFLTSPEFAGTIGPVARLYFAYFLRPPDKEGMDFWVNYRRAGNSMDSISDYFAQSPEFTSTYGALDNAAFVGLVYRNVLGRAPDAGGLAFWRDQLDRNVRTRGQVMLAFSESAEYAALTANDIFVVMTYFGMLQRAPDPGGYAYWVNYMDQGNSGLALIDAFLGAPEYRARFLP